MKLNNSLQASLTSFFVLCNERTGIDLVGSLECTKEEGDHDRDECRNNRRSTQGSVDDVRRTRM